MIAATGIWGRVLCGTDGSPAAEEALRQAFLLAPEASEFLVACVATPASAAHPESVAALTSRAHGAIVAARRIASGRPIEELELEGDPAECLLAVESGADATLLVVGAHHGGRLHGTLAGSVATAVLHRSRGSVLLCRSPGDADRWPARVIVGADGSACSDRAVEVAREIADRMGVELLVVAAAGARLDDHGAAALAPLQHDERDAVTALRATASESELLVVGSRGLHGLQTLGSVSERVAHRAAGSVLVVRKAV